MKASPEEIEILRHATAWPQCYRNYFSASVGSEDCRICESLVRDGLMAGGCKSSTSGDLLFAVTDRGRALLTQLDEDRSQLEWRRRWATRRARSR